MAAPTADRSATADVGLAVYNAWAAATGCALDAAAAQAGKTANEVDDALVALARRTLCPSTAAERAAAARGWTAGRVEAVLGFGRPVFWAFGALFLLDNAGVNVTSLVAGLGVGGVTIALSAQALLTDTVCAVGILLDAPFGIGDFITLDGTAAGTVTAIGLRSVRLVSPDGQAVVVCNKDVAAARVERHPRELRLAGLAYEVIYTVRGATVGEARAATAAVNAAMLAALRREGVALAALPLGGKAE
ncbi:hypothetical protein I4F81_009238 [Pyropia yezoensis]|uniref:Uncharacterized protein n=1 Tax=Pyropia yezoensis TaxID=2788 RepID=A0ACC3C9H8_PYRYE|nr:hypothetical protein I4F81_009238 [Neopyropia yezoensis]